MPCKLLQNEKDLLLRHFHFLNWLFQLLFKKLHSTHHDRFQNSLHTLPKCTKCQYKSPHIRRANFWVLLMRNLFWIKSKSASILTKYLIFSRFMAFKCCHLLWKLMQSFGIKERREKRELWNWAAEQWFCGVLLSSLSNAVCFTQFKNNGELDNWWHWVNFCVQSLFHSSFH